MAERRVEGEDCPIPPHPVLSMDLCQPCIYFRGASSVRRAPDKKEVPVTREPVKWNIFCNFPRNGSDIWKPLEKPLDDYTAEEIKRMSK